MNLFEEYVKVKNEMKELETKKDALELQIMDKLDDEGATSMETDFGQFNIMGRKTYEYSEAVKEAQVALAKDKKIEELNGTATLKSDSRHLRLSVLK